MWAVRAAGAFSANSPGAWFGLEDSERLDSLVVAWPSGAVDTYEDVATKARLELIEGRGMTAVEEEGDGPLPLQYALEPNFSRLAAGRYRAQWHGRVDGGDAAASGVYVASLAAGQDAARQSIILIT